MKAKFTMLLVALAAAAFIAAGCGSDDNNDSSSTSASTPPASSSQSTPSTDTSSSSSGGGGQALKLSADPSGQLKFDKSSLNAKAGKVTITMDNPASIPHAVAVEGNGVDKDGKTAQQGGKSTVSVDLKPGKYTFYCPVPGHEQAGMKGTLTVK
jgi:plastocyanin